MSLAWVYVLLWLVWPPKQISWPASLEVYLSWMERMYAPTADQELCAFWLSVLLLSPWGAKHHVRPVPINLSGHFGSQKAAVYLPCT